MYYRGDKQNLNNTQDQAFEYLNRRFAGRGLAMQARNYADSYGQENVYGARGAVSAPLTLGEFERNYKSRSPYVSGVVSRMNAVPSEAQKPMAHREMRSERPATASAQQRAVPQSVRAQKTATPATAKSASAISRPRRAVKKSENSSNTPFATLAKNFRHLPVGAMLTVVICAVSLMFIVGSSVLMNDASAKYAKMQDEIAVLARQEDELLIALEVKNDLRVIEDIAVNKLGMVKKDLVTRQYIKLGDEDMIETFEDEENNIGISALLSAIKGGK